MVLWCTQDLRRDGCSFLWHQPCQRCKYTTSVDIQKTRYKASHSCRTTCERSESAQESGEQRYISDHQSIKNCTRNMWCVCFLAPVFVFPIHRALNLSIVFLTCVFDLLASGYTREEGVGVGLGGWGSVGGRWGEGGARRTSVYLLHRKFNLLKREISERSARCNFEAVAQYSPLRQTRLAQDLHRDDDTKRPPD